jgi:hypothetical protein
MKKISEWLDDLPAGYRELAVENFIASGWKDSRVESQQEAIGSAFLWDKSQEGEEFWYYVVDHYAKGNPLPPIPKGEPIHAEPCSPFTQDAKERKQYPVYSGFVKYFPDAMAKVANISWAGNNQHHPGTPLHWDRKKSTDESDAMMRHLIDYSKSGNIDELAKVAWRALAWLQKTIEKGE